MQYARRLFSFFIVCAFCAGCSDQHSPDPYKEHYTLQRSQHISYSSTPEDESFQAEASGYFENEHGKAVIENTADNYDFQDTTTFDDGSRLHQKFQGSQELESEWKQ